MRYSRRPAVDPTIEKRILTGMIVSDYLARELSPLGEPDFFETIVARRVYPLIQQYVESYRKAPRSHIQDLYYEAKQDPSFKETDQIEVEDFLTRLSEEYEDMQGEINEEYTEKIAKDFFKRRSIILAAGEAGELAKAGELDKAESRILRYRKEEAAKLTSWTSPLTDTSRLYNITAEEKESVFEAPGAIGELLGPLRRNWLVGVMAPMGYGKTHCLISLSLWALMERRKVAFFSLEMDDDEITERFVLAMSALNPGKNPVTVPVFDCAANQKNECIRPERNCSEPRPEKFDPQQSYQACTYCRDADPGIYRPAVWFARRKYPPLNHKNIKKSAAAFSRMFGRDNFRIFFHAAYTINSQDIATQLDVAESVDGFIPDVIIVDYGERMKPEERGLIGRDKVNATWMNLKSLAQLRKAIVINASQANREAFEAEIIQEKNTSEDIRKLAETDIMLTINRSDIERKFNQFRIGLLKHRHREWGKYRQALCLQNLEIGQFVLDSEIINIQPRKKKVDKEEKENGQ